MGKWVKLKKELSVKGQHSIAVRLMVMFLVMLLIFGTTFVVSTLVINRRARIDMEIRESETLINSVSGSIQGSFDTYKDITRLVMLNQNVCTFLRAETADPGLVNDANRGVWDVLNVCRGVDSVFIFRNDGAYANTGKGIYLIDHGLMDTADWKEAINDRRGGAIITMNGNGALFRRNQTPIITIARAIYDIYTQGQTGMLLMNISPVAFDQVVHSQQTAELAILARDGTFLAGDASLADQYSRRFVSDSIVHISVGKGNDQSMISGSSIEGLPLMVICRTTAGMDAFPRETLNVMLVLLLAFLISLVVAGVWIIQNVTHPIYTLAGEMEKTKQSGWLRKVEAPMPENELSVLKDSYNSAVEYSTDLFSRLLDKEKVAQKAEMRVLYEQIKPHFLYNSMETIGYMAVEAGADKVHDALETLGSFYRNFLSRGEREIPLRSEVNIVRDYLALQKLRYSDILEDEYDLAEDTLDIRVPKLMLQPLVENSIYHGIRMTGEPGKIRITSSLEDDILHVLVYDTGVGMDEDTIHNLLEPGAESQESAGTGSGFGLRGTIERIRYFCDREDVVKIRSEIGEYTEIEIMIPIRRGENYVQSHADR